MDWPQPTACVCASLCLYRNCCVPPYCAVVHCTTNCFDMLRLAAPCCAVQYCAAPCCAVQYCAAPCCAVQYCAAPCCAVQYCAAPCCAVQYCAAPCCAVQYCAAPCCAVQYCAAPCCAAPCCAVQYCAAPCCAVQYCVFDCQPFYSQVSPGDMGWDVFSLDYHVDGPISTVRLKEYPPFPHLHVYRTFTLFDIRGIGMRALGGF